MPFDFDLKPTENLRYHVDVSYDTDYNCNAEGCDDEGICRCGQIVNAQVNLESFHSILSFASFMEEYWSDDKVLSATENALEKTLTLQWLRRKFHSDDFRVAVCGGYYGEEIDGVFLDSSTSLKEGLEKFKALSTKEKVEAWLNLEYGRVLDSIKEIKDWKLVKLPIDHVHDLTVSPLKDEQVRRYLRNIVYEPVSKKVASKTNAKYVDVFDETTSEPSPELAPLCLPQAHKPGHYRVIDGRHRFHAWSKFPTYRTKKRGYGLSAYSLIKSTETWAIIPAGQ